MVVRHNFVNHIRSCADVFADHAAFGICLVNDAFGNNNRCRAHGCNQVVERQHRLFQPDCHCIVVNFLETGAARCGPHHAVGNPAVHGGHNVVSFHLLAVVEQHAVTQPVSELRMIVIRFHRLGQFRIDFLVLVNIDQPFVYISHDHLKPYCRSGLRKIIMSRLGVNRHADLLFQCCACTLRRKNSKKNSGGYFSHD